MALLRLDDLFVRLFEGRCAMEEVLTYVDWRRMVISHASRGCVMVSER